MTDTAEKLSELLINYTSQNDMVNNNYNSGKENMFSAQIINEVNSIRNEVAGVLIRVRPDITDQEIKINHSQELEFAVKHNIPVAIMSE